MYIGIDPSSQKLAMFANTPSGWKAETFGLGTPFKPMNTRLAQDSVHQFLRTATLDEVRIAVIEAPLVAGARNLQSTIKQAKVVGAVQAALLEWDFAVYEAAVSSWKKAVVGHGGADKATVAKWLSKNHPSLSSLCCGDQDLVDAACLSLYAESLGGIASRLVK